MSHEVVCGDSAEVLKGFEDDSFECVVTDPPHGLEFMGADWDTELPAQAVWDETFRVLKPGGHVWVMASDRPDCFCGFYLALKKAGFAIDNSQFVVWLQLQGMPKSSDVSKTADKQAFRAWLAHVGAELTAEERRKAESAAVGGAEYVASDGVHRNEGGSFSREHSEGRTHRSLGGVTYKRDEGTALLSSLLSSHWPASASEQLAHWQAVVGEVPEGWDTSRPPGVRVKTGEEIGHRKLGSGEGGYHGHAKESYRQQGREATVLSITAPSTPLAAEWSGWRGSIAPFRPLASLILHAQKPWGGGTYLDCAREHGTGSVDVEAGRIPFQAGDEPASVVGDYGMPHVNCYVPTRKRVNFLPSSSGRVPGNLLTYADLLGSLTHQADLDAWAAHLGLPTASAELLEAGVCYAPKPSRAEKEAGLGEEFPAEQAANPNYGKGGFARPTGQPEREIAPQRNQHPTTKPVSLCAFLVALSTREGDRVLDPFLGSGTTIVAAKMLGRDGVGVELSEEYAAIARARILAAEPVTAPQTELALVGGN